MARRAKRLLLQGEHCVQISRISRSGTRWHMPAVPLTVRWKTETGESLGPPWPSRSSHPQHQGRKYAPACLALRWWQGSRLRCSSLRSISSPEPTAQPCSVLLAGEIICVIYVYMQILYICAYIHTYIHLFDCSIVISHSIICGLICL